MGNERTFGGLLDALTDALVDKPFLPYSDLEIEGINLKGKEEKEKFKNLLKSIRSEESLRDKIENASEENKYFFNMVKQIYEDPNLVLNIPRISKNKILNPPIYPSIIEFHLGNACQFKCKFCFSRGEELKIQNKYPKFNQYPPLDKYSIMRCINEIKELGCNRVYFSGGLETFKSDLVTDVIRSIEDEMVVYVYSNGEAINDTTIDVLLKKVNRVRISLHAFKGSTFKNIQCPHIDNDDIAKKMFDTVKDNIKKLLLKRNSNEIIKERKDKKKEPLQIGLSFLLMPENTGELQQFIEYWQEEGIDFIDVTKNVLEERIATKSILTIPEWDDIVKNLLSKNYKNKNGENLLGINRYKMRQKLKKSKVCYSFLKKIVIDPYGDVWACCLQAHPGYQRHNLHLGNIKEESIIYIIQKWERIFSAGDKIIEIEHCTDCTDWEYNFNVTMSKIIEDQKNDFGVFDHYFLPENIEKITLDKIISSQIGIKVHDPRF
jgi:MoaA/NifB/PqqE/SkfB family radical SAM enzyme